MVESAPLLREYTPNGVSRVRIPLPPQLKSRLSLLNVIIGFFYGMNPMLNLKETIRSLVVLKSVL